MVVVIAIVFSVSSFSKLVLFGEGRELVTDGAIDRNPSYFNIKRQADGTHLSRWSLFHGVQP